MTDRIPSVVVECPMVSGIKPKRNDRCINPSIDCMHNVDGKCCWVEIGDIEGFVTLRGITNNKFTAEAKKESAKIRELVIVDSYYNYLKSRFNIYPKTRCSRVLSFPFDYVDHYWSDELLLEATKGSVLEDFCSDLPERSADILRAAIENLLNNFA